MSKIAKFLENELDRVNNYLAMAKANLVVASELCENKCSNFSTELSKTDEKVLDYLNRELSKLEANICNSTEIIDKFKNYYFKLEK